MDDLRNVLKKSCDDILMYLEQQNSESYIDFMFGIDEYDKLVDVLQPVFIDQNMIDRKSFMDVITVYETRIKNIYFIGMEQYGYADEDAIIYRVCFTNDLEKMLSDCKIYMMQNDFIKMRINSTL